MTEENRQFDTGAQRDTGEGKLRMSLVPQKELKRVMKRYLDGAEKYGALTMNAKSYTFLEPSSS